MALNRRAWLREKRAFAARKPSALGKAPAQETALDAREIRVVVLARAQHCAKATSEELRALTCWPAVPPVLVRCRPVLARTFHQYGPPSTRRLLRRPRVRPPFHLWSSRHRRSARVAPFADWIMSPRWTGVAPNWAGVPPRNRVRSVRSRSHRRPLPRVHRAPHPMS